VLASADWQRREEYLCNLIIERTGAIALELKARARPQGAGPGIEVAGGLAWPFQLHGQPGQTTAARRQAGPPSVSVSEKAGRPD
jgi:hypothetical protein